MASDDTGIDEEAEEEANLLADTDDRLDKAEPDEGLLVDDFSQVRYFFDMCVK